MASTRSASPARSSPSASGVRPPVGSCANRAAASFKTSTVWLNGAPAGRIEFDGELGAAVSLVVEDGRLTRIYIMRNPRKLARLDETAELAR